MNTSRIGTEYERAYRNFLESTGYLVTRSAASKGPWDLVATVREICWHIQLKAGKISCVAAEYKAHSLKEQLLQAPSCGVLVVHKLERERFCEHVG